jgi:hypothetical protein
MPKDKGPNHDSVQDNSGQSMRKLNQKTKIAIVGVIGLVVGGCLVWQFLNSKIARPVVEQKAREILKTDLFLELTNSWRTVNASGGLVGSPFYSFRWWREYFVEKESDFAALEFLSNELGARHSVNDFTFLPLGYAKTFLPYRNAADLAPWWQPETNSEPMLHVSVNRGGRIVYIYAFKKATNGLAYIHIIEH